MRKLNFTILITMRYSLLFGMALLFSVASLQAESLKILIKIENAVEKEVAIFYYKNMEAENVSIAKINLGDDGIANFMFDLSDDQVVQIHYAEQVIPVFMAIPNSLEMYFDAGNIWETLRFEGEGAEANNFLAAFNRKFPPQSAGLYRAGYLTVEFPDDLGMKFRSLESDQFLEAMNQRETEQAAFFKKQKQVPKALVQQFAVKAKYENASELLMYYVLNMPYWSKEKMLLEKEKNKAFRWQKLKNEELIGEKYYQNFLKTYLFYSFLPGNLDDFDAVNLLYDHTTEHFKKQTKYWLQAQLMLGEYNRTGRTRLAKKHFNTFYEQNTYPAFSQAVIDTYGMDLDFVPQTDAPDFSTTDLQGKTVQLSDFKGKVVYISFWASWCKPCLKGFAQSQYLREQLEEMGVILLNVSLDKEEEVWRKTLSKNKIIGTNVLAPGMESVQKVYGLSTLPAYHIVGKDGRFCYLSENESRNILDEFDGFLKKK